MFCLLDENCNTISRFIYKQTQNLKYCVQQKTYKKETSYYLHLPKKYLKYQRVWCSGFSNMGALGEPNTFKKMKIEEKIETFVI